MMFGTEQTGGFGRWTHLPDACGRLSEWDFVGCVFPIIDGIELVTDPAGRRFFLRHFKKYSAHTVAHCLYDLVLPRLLAADGALVLHAGLVDSPKGALGFLAPSGQGKSTLTASLHRRGMRLMGDDALHLRIEGSICTATRVNPSLRLFPDALNEVVPNAGKTSMMADYSDKRRIRLSEGPESARLEALFVLRDPAENVSVRRLSEAEACMAIIANAFALDLSDPEETKLRFSLSAEAARSIPVYDLHYPRDFAALPEVHAAIFETVGLTPAMEQPA